MLSLSPGSTRSLLKPKALATPPALTLTSASPGPTHSLRPPTTDFDAGLNSSAAWTARLERAADVLSDDESESDAGSVHRAQREKGRPARALYAFEGKPEFRELNVHAGDSLEVIRPEAGEGWSLVKCGREVGLLPQSYYIYTSEFVRSPGPEQKRLSNGSLTPRGSPEHKPHELAAPAAPLIPQTTGEWLRALPSFRRSLLGGKAFNRFSSFVTSGAEAFVLSGADVEPLPGPSHARGHSREATNASIDAPLGPSVGGESDQHFVDAGPSWRQKVPPFRVLVHSPTKQRGALAQDYIVYGVTSLFHPDTLEDAAAADRGHAREGSASSMATMQHAALARLTVHRRFSHFVALHAALLRRLPGLALPPLPEKQYAGRFSNDFVEARRGELERYLARLVRHPVVRYAEVLTFFLSCESDADWKKHLPEHLTLPPAGPAFYARVYHPEFNVDHEDAAHAVDRFEAHTKAVGRGVQDLRGVFGRMREARVEMSKAERTLSNSLLSLITSRPSVSSPHLDADPDEDHPYRSRRESGLMNEDGAWCWRDHCDECLKLTKAMQKTADTLQNVADLFDDHARRRQLATHEMLKTVAHPSTVYAAVIDTHRSTLSRYSPDGLPAPVVEDVAARCETVLNTTMAEMDTYHTQKVEDFGALTREHLEGEIELYEQVLQRLYGARQTFDAAEYDVLARSPRQPSMYEREIGAARAPPAPLPQPCPHVFDSAPMRPVTHAIQDGVGLLASAGRVSVLGKLWQ